MIWIKLSANKHVTNGQDVQWFYIITLISWPWINFVALQESLKFVQMVGLFYKESVSKILSLTLPCHGTKQEFSARFLAEIWHPWKTMKHKIFSLPCLILELRRLGLEGGRLAGDGLGLMALPLTGQKAGTDINPLVTVPTWNSSTGTQLRKAGMIFLHTQIRRDTFCVNWVWKYGTQYR